MDGGVEAAEGSKGKSAGSSKSSERTEPADHHVQLTGFAPVVDRSGNVIHQGQLGQQHRGQQGRRGR